MTLNLNLELTDHCNIKCRMCSQSMRDEAHGVPMRFIGISSVMRCFSSGEDIA